MKLPTLPYTVADWNAQPGRKEYRGEVKKRVGDLRARSLETMKGYYAFESMSV